MTEILNNLMPHISALGYWGYWIFFFAAMFEAVAFLGILIPGSIIVTFGGFLANIGYFDIGDVFWFCLFGAIVGDNISFYLGQKGTIMFKDGNRLFKKSYLNKATEFFNLHGGKSIIIGRFTGGIRAIVPFVAGMSHMNQKQFFYYNIAGAIIWSSTHVLAGYFFGHAWRALGIWSTRVGAVILVGIIIASIIYVFKRVKK